MKSIWKGSLSFGLVDIPVELYGAVQTRVLNFKLFHIKCQSPISYHRWCEHCHKEVSWYDIEKGIKLRDGTFFMMTPARLKALKHEKTQAIEILAFVDLESIDPVLFNERFYVAPAKMPYYAFFLFVQALTDLHKVAIGRFVLREKEYVCVLQPYKNSILLTTLNYAYEIKKMDIGLPSKMPAINAKELAMAEQLIKSMITKKFHIQAYKDTFVANLLKKISLLKKGHAFPMPKQPRQAEQKQKTLLDTLKDSLKKGKSGKKKSV